MPIIFCFTDRRYKTVQTLSTVSIILFIAAHAHGMGVKECLQAAKTPLENSYCAILKAGEGDNLPNFYDFRRNNESTQRLFLRGPAAKANIELPQTSANTNTNKKPVRPTLPSTPPPRVNTQLPKKHNDYAPPVRERSSGDGDLSQCRIQKNRILCNAQQYFLAINVPLKRISATALSDQNRLIFRAKSAQESLIEYLSDMYPYYIEKMLQLGLGDSTLSFTKFHAIHENADNNQAFRERFYEMYELLKKERQTMAIKSRYTNNFPSNIENCMQINTQLIACDNVAQNWVYRKMTMR